jgi:hypothetical protein
MSAELARAAHNRKLQSTEPIAHRGATAFDVERIGGPFGADIAQLAHAIRRLLENGTGVGTRPLNSRRPRSPSPTCISGGFERLM